MLRWDLGIQTQRGYPCAVSAQRFEAPERTVVLSSDALVEKWYRADVLTHCIGKQANDFALDRPLRAFPATSPEP